MKTEATPLKPCPCCAGGAELRSRFDVKCTGCGLEINSLTPEKDWNRRVSDSPAVTALKSQVKQLREALTNVLSKFPYAEMLDAVDDDEYSGRRYVSLEKVTIGDVRRWRAALSEGEK